MNELYHHGVKGMKWGVRRAKKLEAKVEKKYARAGVAQGHAEFHRNKGKADYEKHERNAKVFDKTAKKYEREGKYFRAEAARKAARAIRARGENIKASSDELAARFERKAAKITEKASAYATKKRVDLGKQRIDSILKSYASKGKDQAKRWDDNEREAQLWDRYGDDGYSVYNKLRGMDD